MHTLRFWLRRVLPARSMSVAPSEYHDEGMTLYEITTSWSWGPFSTEPKSKVLV